MKITKSLILVTNVWCFVIQIEWGKERLCDLYQKRWRGYLFKHKPYLKITTMDKLKEHIFSLISKRRSLCLQCDFMSDFQTLCFYDGVWVIPQLVWFFVIKILEIVQVNSFRFGFSIDGLGWPRRLNLRSSSHWGHWSTLDISDDLKNESFYDFLTLKVAHFDWQPPRLSRHENSNIWFCN